MSTPLSPALCLRRPPESYPRLTPVDTVFGTDHTIAQPVSARTSASDAVGPPFGGLIRPWVRLGKAA